MTWGLPISKGSAVLRVTLCERHRAARVPLVEGLAGHVHGGWMA